MKILHVNVRYSHGGAAGVARTLMREAIAMGHEARFAYGYGPGGGRDYAAPSDAVRATSKLVAATNFGIHCMIGAEPVASHGSYRQNLLDLLEWCDVVHLHAVHSYMIPFATLVSDIESARKPVVWTMHDHWAVTGRCAQPETCQRWLAGCGHCPNKLAYPPAKLDRTKSGWTRKRSQIGRLRKNGLRIVSCANWLADDIAGVVDESVTHTANGLDRSFLDALAPPENRQPSPILRLVFLCRDLRDRRKVDVGVLNSIASLAHIQLTVVGDNAPLTLSKNCMRRPALSSRSDLAQEMSDHDGLLFTSRVDYYPLTIAEALCAGLSVFGLNSPAVMEFANLGQVYSFKDGDELINGLRCQTRFQHPVRASVANARRFFSPDRMTESYLQEYASLLAEDPP